MIFELVFKIAKVYSNLANNKLIPTNSLVKVIMYTIQHNHVRIQYLSNTETEPVIIMGLFQREQSLYYRSSRWINPTKKHVYKLNKYLLTKGTMS